MTADRNQVEAGDSAARLGAVIPLALAAVAGLLHPYPGAILVLVPAGALTIIGIWTFIRRPERRGSIVAVWIVVPCLVLLVLSSTHGVYFRYLLPILPVALALPFVGIDASVKQLHRRVGAGAVLVLRFSLLALLFISYLTGIRAYEQGYISTGPIKRDCGEPSLNNTPPQRHLRVAW